MDIEALTALRTRLTRQFNLDEMDVLLSDLGAPPQDVPGRDQGRTIYAQQIIEYFQRRGRLPDLIAYCDRERPIRTKDAPLDHTHPQRAERVNPFYTQGRINDPALFFGRAQVLREVKAALGQRASVSLIGESRIGKSSLLYYLYATREAWLPGVTVEYVDLQREWDQTTFCETVLHKLGEPGDTPQQLKRH